MRRKKQQPEQTYKSRVWFVLKAVHRKEWSEKFGLFVWCPVLNERVTPDRATQHQADEDFKALGYKINLTATCQYHKERKGNVMTEYIVQCHTDY